MIQDYQTENTLQTKNMEATITMLRLKKKITKQGIPLKLIALL